MSRTNYQKGYAFELRVKKRLEKIGYFVVRSAGSKGPADLVALDGGGVKFFQCKSSSAAVSNSELERCAKLSKLGGFYFIFPGEKKGLVAWIEDNGVLCPATRSTFEDYFKRRYVTW